MRALHPAFLLALWLGPVACLYAQQGEPTPVDARPVRVAAFKNGYGVVDSVVTLPHGPAGFDHGVFRLAPLPESTFGSLVLSWTQGIAVRDVKATPIQVESHAAAASIADLLEANVGKRVEFTLRDKAIAGTVVAVPSQEQAPPHPQPRGPWYPAPLPASILPPPVRGQVVLVEYEGGVHAVNMNTISDVRFPEAPSLRTKKVVAGSALDFTASNTLAGPGPKGPAVGLTYLAQGIAWMPSYHVDITHAQNATLRMSAVLVNDLMPLRDTAVELVAGFPNIEFAAAPSALSLTPLQQLITALNAPRSERDRFSRMDNVMTQRAVYDAGGEMAPGMPNAPVMGEATEDLFFYPVKSVTLDKGQRGYYVLLVANVPYKHVYTWDIPDTINEQSQRRVDPAERPQQVVWHAINLTNTTGQPWTTAPGTTTKSGRVLGQSTLHYTPADGTTDLRITQAINIRAEEAEQEVERRRNATQFYGHNYDLVTVKGELVLTSFLNKPVEVRVTKHLSGEVTQADREPTMVKLARGLRMVNPSVKLTWTLPVQPGKDNTATVTYTYGVYVRN